MNLLLPLVVTLTAVVAAFVPWFVTRMMAGDAATELGVQIAHKNLEHLKHSIDWRVSLPKMIIEFVITQTPENRTYDTCVPFGLRMIQAALPMVYVSGAGFAEDYGSVCITSVFGRALRFTNGTTLPHPETGVRLPTVYQTKYDMQTLTPSAPTTAYSELYETTKRPWMKMFIGLCAPCLCPACARAPPCAPACLRGSVGRRLGVGARACACTCACVRA